MSFFFSSRRRHTRLQGDWSSDVCSSDLGGECRDSQGRDQPDDGERPCPHRKTSCRGPPTLSYPAESGKPTGKVVRSEERRVGKEGRARWGEDEYKKKRDSRKR